MRILKLDESTKKNLLEDLLKRSPNQYTEYEERVAAILNAVKLQKDQALFDFTKKFDGASIDASTIRVTDEEIQEAYKTVDATLLDIIRKAKKNIQEYHEKHDVLPSLCFCPKQEVLSWNGPLTDPVQ